MIRSDTRKEANIVKRVSLLILLLLLATPPVASQVPDDKLIVPGQRVGKWTLEMTIGDFVRMNGEDYLEGKDSSVDAQGELLFRAWIHLALSVGYRRNQTRIEYLAVSSLGFSFPLGDPRPKALKAKYPDISVREISAFGAGVTGFIIVNAPAEVVRDYKTVKGISNFAFYETILDAYGKPTAETAMLKAVTPPKRWIYNELGIAFRVQDLRGRQIFVFRPGTAKSIWNF